MYAFIHIPKTGGTSLVHLLRRAFGSGHCDMRLPLHKRQGHQWLDAEDFTRVMRIYPRLSGIAGHNVCCFHDLESASDDLQFFSFLRSPEQRYISHFCHVHRKLQRALTESDLDAHLRRPKYNNVQTRWLCGNEDPTAAIQLLNTRIGFVGLTEQFDKSLLLWRRWLAQPQFDLSYVAQNRRRKRLPDGLLDRSEYRQRIAAANHSDREVYQYVCDTIFPRQVAEYGSTLTDELTQFRHLNRAECVTPEPLRSRIQRNLVYKPLLHMHVL